MAFQPIAATPDDALRGQILDGLAAQSATADTKQLVRLANVLAAVISGAVSPQTAETNLAADAGVGDLLQGLGGVSLRANDAVISFGAGNQFGDVSIRDVARAIVKLNVQIVTGGEDRYDVRGVPNPYLGLQPFSYNNQEDYAGRENTLHEGIQRLTGPGTARGIIFILGASGAGKSSFAQAGMVPQLELYYTTKTPPRPIRRALMRPGDDPRDGLAHALGQLGLTPAAGSSCEALIDTLAAAATQDQQISLVVLDQLEEIFTQVDARQRQAFLEAISRLADFDVAATHLIVTMRKDYLADLRAYPVLYTLAKRGIVLEAMRPIALRAAICRPLQRRFPNGEKKFEEALLDQLIADAGGDATYLPLLQVTLEDLWARGWLRLSSYHDLATAIGSWSDQIVAWEDPDSGRPRPSADRQILESLLPEMVEVSLSPADNRDARRYRKLAELANTERKVALVRDLIDARLLSQNDDQVTLIHEALIRNWPLLSKQIDNQRDHLRKRARFEYALREWVGGDEDSSYLLVGTRLLCFGS